MIFIICINFSYYLCFGFWVVIGRDFLRFLIILLVILLMWWSMWVIGVLVLGFVIDLFFFLGLWFNCLGLCMWFIGFCFFLSEFFLVGFCFGCFWFFLFSVRFVLLGKFVLVGFCFGCVCFFLFSVRFILLCFGFFFFDCFIGVEVFVRGSGMGFLRF